MSLPDAVTTLRCPNGSTVHIVGTAHFSRESAEDVRTTIARTNPQVSRGSYVRESSQYGQHYAAYFDYPSPPASPPPFLLLQVVVLELCQDRQLILLYGEEEILREAQSMNMAKVRSFIRRDGVVAGLTQSLFLKMSAQLTNQLGVAPGGEFRAGFEEAQKIGAKVVLGDRSVGITFKRALAALSFWKRLYLGYLLVRTLSSKLDITPEEVEEMKKKDMVTLMMGELATDLPDISEVFVTERDKILAYSLMRAANCVQDHVGPPVTVVGVMGMGHVPGIEAHWMQPIPLKELLTVPTPSRTSRVVWGGVKLGTALVVVGLTVAGVWHAVGLCRR